MRPRLDILLIIISLLIGTFVASCSATSAEDKDIRYFEIQSKVIQASIAQRFEKLKAANKSCYPYYLDEAFTSHLSPGWGHHVHSHRFFTALLLSEHNVQLIKTKSGYEVYDRSSEKSLDVFERKDWPTIRALVRDCNTLLDEYGRLACEFDGGDDFTDTPFTTLLFNVAYMEYQSQGLVYQGGRYELVGKDSSSVSFNMDDLLKRNGIVKMVYYRLMANIDSIFRGREGDTLGPFTSYDVGFTDWRSFLKNGLRIGTEFTRSGFKIIDFDTDEGIAFPPDQDLISEALDELNYYREEVDFGEYFMMANYPMFLLSILRIYDVNLQVDQATNKIIIVPGPTDPQAFFDIVAECTFVNDPSDTEYLKEHLTSWLEPDQTK
jgi:hypothetical protein